MQLLNQVVSVRMLISRSVRRVWSMTLALLRIVSLFETMFLKVGTAEKILKARREKMVHSDAI